MKWVKEIIVDILVTLSIVISSIFSIIWIKSILILYSVLILLLKGMVLWNPDLNKTLRRRPQKAPLAIYHSLYACNVIFPMLHGWWVFSLVWVGIWGLSWYAWQKKTPRK